MLMEKERNHEENLPVRDQGHYPMNAPAATSTTELLAAIAIPGMSV